MSVITQRQKQTVVQRSGCSGVEMLCRFGQWIDPESFHSLHNEPMFDAGFEDPIHLNQGIAELAVLFWDEISWKLWTKGFLICEGEHLFFVVLHTQL